MIIKIPASNISIDEQLCCELAKEKELNHSMLIKIMPNIRFLARQGLALKGDGNEDDGNFFQMIDFSLLMHFTLQALG